MRRFEAWHREQHPSLLLAVTLLAGDLEVARDIASEAFLWGSRKRIELQPADIAGLPQRR